MPSASGGGDGGENNDEFHIPFNNGTNNFRGTANMMGDEDFFSSCKSKDPSNSYSVKYL